MKKIFCAFALVSIAATLTAQQTEKWTLRKCVDYAVQNNISVKQADVQARIAALQVKQAKLYQLPNASFSTGIYPQFGRTIDRTTNSFSNTSIVTQNYSVQGSIDIFNFGKLKNNIAANTFNAQAALADVEKTANDVALSVATYYLQVIASYQQINITKVQIAQTQYNLDFTKKKVIAGSLPELNALQFESQLASDSSNFVTAQTSYNQSILALKGVLNIDASVAFEVDIPEADKIPLENLTDLQPETVYSLAINNQPTIKANHFRIKGAEKSILANKAAMYPSLTGSYQLSSNYANKAQEVTGYSINNQLVGFANVAGSNYDVYIYSPEYTTKNTNYFKQLGNNFGQSIGINLSIPIFNNGTYRINYEQSKLNLQNAKITEQQIEQKLKLDIYTAYSNAVNALQKFNASKKQVDLTKKTYDFANKRFEVGLLSSFDLLTSQSNLVRAKTQLLSDEYDYVFKMKLLEFYKGQGLKL
ncbi:MAG: TolC family protein [Bacteroidetes bacterium]|nr:TolC family protein [Bacteroidota bacterium]